MATVVLPPPIVGVGPGTSGFAGAAVTSGAEAPSGIAKDGYAAAPETPVALVMRSPAAMRFGDLSPLSDASPPVTQSAHWALRAGAVASVDGVEVFFREVEDREQALYVKILELVDSKINNIALTQLIQDEILPELFTMCDSICLVAGRFSTPRTHAIKHDVVGRKFNLKMLLVGNVLTDEIRQMLRTFATLSTSSLDGVVKFIGILTPGVIARPDALHYYLTDPGQMGPFRRIVENLLRNSGQHPREGGDVTTVEVTLEANRLTFRDNGAGMSPQTLADIRAGERLHNGVVLEETDESPHGFGWQSIREMATALGISVDIDSRWGLGTTVTLLLPEGFLVAGTP